MQLDLIKSKVERAHEVNLEALVTSTFDKEQEERLLEFHRKQNELQEEKDKRVHIRNLLGRSQFTNYEYGKHTLPKPSQMKVIKSIEQIKRSFRHKADSADLKVVEV